MTAAAWILLVMAVSAFAALGNTLLKLGATQKAGEDPMEIGNLPRAMFRPAIIGGIAAYGAQQLLWITLLRIADLSFAYPLQVGLNFILIMTVAWAYFKEPLSRGKLAGVLLIFAGIVTIAAG